MKISIVTVSYNQGQYIEECINSVLSQSYKNFEYILIDGGSTDGTLDILDKYQNDIDYIRSEKDDGPANALNKGFSKATGDLLCYLNSDDILEPHAFQTWIREFKENPTIDIVYGNTRFIDKLGDLYRLKYASTFIAAPFRMSRFAVGACTIPQQSTCWRRNVWSRVGQFNESNTTCWDWEFFVDAALQGCKFRHINQIISNFRIHEGSISGKSAMGVSNREKQRKIDHERVNKKLKQAGYKFSKQKIKILKLEEQVLRAFNHLTMSR